MPHPDTYSKYKNAGWKNRSIRNCATAKREQKNNPIILLIGEGQTQGSGFDRRFTVPEEPFVEEACRFEQVCGIYIRSQSGRNWMTVFDDEPIAIENLGKPEEIKAETDEENVKRVKQIKKPLKKMKQIKKMLGLRKTKKRKIYRVRS